MGGMILFGDASRQPRRFPVVTTAIIPFDFQRRRLWVVLERQSRRILITKGAPEGIFPLLSGYELDGKAVPIDADAAKRLAAGEIFDFCRRGDGVYLALVEAAKRRLLRVENQTNKLKPTEALAIAT